jgi:thiosulfate/3-mercaptopyruvate sulfurtransferase
MIPGEGYFSQSVQELGISNSSKIVVYDGAGLFSAARVWWLFRAFGHADIAILDGGLPAWIEKGFEVTNFVTDINPGNFAAKLDSSLFTSVQDMRENCRSRHYTVLDARSGARYRGEAPEPRPELPSGHMPGSTSLPLTDLVSDGSLKPDAALQEIFANAGVAAQTPVITSCGSGVTAAVITLALENCGFGLQKLYDGSWTEWASGNDNPIVTGQEPG